LIPCHALQQKRENYSPGYGFRLVVRKIHNKRVLSDIRAKTILRKTIPSIKTSSVSTFEDEMLLNFEDLFILLQSDKFF
jgi:hypothetical protein